MIYISEKQANREVNPVDTSPEHQLTFLVGLWKDYEAVLGKNFADVPVAEFKKRASASVREVDRRKMDGSDNQ
jgi:hypothetical protein